MSQAQRNQILAVRILCILCVCGLLVFAYAMGKGSIGPKVSAGSAEPVQLTDSSEVVLLSPDEILQVDDALRRAAGGDMESALALLEGLSSPGGHPGPAIALALQQIRTRRVSPEENPGPPVSLSYAAARSQSTAKAVIIRARLLAENKEFPAAFVEFERAARIAPFDFEVFLFWSDGLREFGRVREGITRAEQAFLRATEPWQLVVAEVKLALARAEAGESSAVAAEGSDIANSMASAVLALNGGDFAAASEWLQKSRAALPAELFELFIEDIAFAPYRADPDLAADFSAR